MTGVSRVSDLLLPGLRQTPRNPRITGQPRDAAAFRGTDADLQGLGLIKFIRDRLLDFQPRLVECK